MGKQGITADFVRRVEFRVFKYSMVYHWLWVDAPCPATVY
jgi:hypothetical protein